MEERIKDLKEKKAKKRIALGLKNDDVIIEEKNEGGEESEEDDEDEDAPEESKHVMEEDEDEEEEVYMCILCLCMNKCIIFLPSCASG
jgi:hypothetical protein